MSRSSKMDRPHRSADPHGKTSGRREHRRAASVVGDGEHHPFAAPSRSSTDPTKSEKFSPRGLVADPAMLSRYFPTPTCVWYDFLCSSVARRRFGLWRAIYGAARRVFGQNGEGMISGKPMLVGIGRHVICGSVLQIAACFPSSAYKATSI